jgi:hypothetical protein
MTAASPQKNLKLARRTKNRRARFDSEATTGPGWSQVCRDFLRSASQRAIQFLENCWYLGLVELKGKSKAREGLGGMLSRNAFPLEVSPSVALDIDSQLAFRRVEHSFLNFERIQSSKTIAKRWEIAPEQICHVRGAETVNDYLYSRVDVVMVSPASELSRE